MTEPSDAQLFVTSRRIGRWTFLIVSVGTLVVLISGLFFRGTAFNDAAPSTTSITSSTTAPATSTSTESTTSSSTQSPQPSLPPDTEKVTTSEASGSSTTTVVSSTSPDSSFLGQALGNPFAPFLIAVLAAILAGYLAAAAAQRVYLGRYAFKIGPVEIPEVPVSTSEVKEAADLVTLKDVLGRPLAPKLPAATWWADLPRDDCDPRCGFLFYRTALEAGVREVVWSADFYAKGEREGHLRWADLLEAYRGARDFRGADRNDFVTGLDRLARLGDRIRCGATVAADAEVQLRAAFADAIGALAVELGQILGASYPEDPRLQDIGRK